MHIIFRSSCKRIIQKETNPGQLTAMLGLVRLCQVLVVYALSGDTIPAYAKRVPAIGVAHPESHFATDR